MPHRRLWPLVISLLRAASCRLHCTHHHPIYNLSCTHHRHNHTPYNSFLGHTSGDSTMPLRTPLVSWLVPVFGRQPYPDDCDDTGRMLFLDTAWPLSYQGRWWLHAGWSSELSTHSVSFFKLCRWWSWHLNQRLVHPMSYIWWFISMIRTYIVGIFGDPRTVQCLHRSFHYADRTHTDEFQQQLTQQYFYPHHQSTLNFSCSWQTSGWHQMTTRYKHECCNIRSQKDIQLPILYWCLTNIKQYVHGIILCIIKWLW